MRVVVNRTADGKFQKLEDMLDGYPEVYLRKFSEELVMNSPVDTGTYMDNHFVESSGTSGTKTSKGKPGKQPWDSYAKKALARLMSGISLLGNVSQVTFGNESYHRDLVEYKHGWAPFRRTMREHRRIASEALNEVRMRNG